ncbi:jg11938 [Pararge aegeria aegeria]|uniref:Jg11938 protein n=1 Tax=Pararge aegeria aegeria TaxID=348720 RepID=A0A8S4S6T4_9NEOP|nr:jg11938 [Pararge aegeria aegeria]
MEAGRAFQILAVRITREEAVIAQSNKQINFLTTMNGYTVICPPRWGSTNAAPASSPGAAISAPWDHNVHPFSELCAAPIATAASRLVELCR